MSIQEAQREGHEDGRCAAVYEQKLKEHFRGVFPITLEYALECSDTYWYMSTQEEVGVYNASFSATYLALTPYQKTNRLKKPDVTQESNTDK
jgi:hypothetical protein